ncbi:MAG: nuclear transport factor 2 family protein [bacterium]
MDVSHVEGILNPAPSAGKSTGISKLFFPELTSWTVHAISLDGLFCCSYLMKLFPILLLVSALAISPAVPIVAPHVITQSQPKVEKRLSREIDGVEDQLRKAIARKDAKSLDRLLADYYADAYEGSERAFGKKPTLAECRAGTLHYYKIDKERKLTVRGGDIIQLEGISRLNEKSAGNTGTESEVHVTRLWSRESGHWNLISQTVGLHDEDAENK